MSVVKISKQHRGSLVLPRGILDTCSYPHGMPYVNSDPCLLFLIKSLLQINKYPSKHDSLLTLLGNFLLDCPKAGRRRCEPKAFN